MRFLTHFRRVAPRATFAMSAMVAAASASGQYAPYVPQSQPQYAQRGAYGTYAPAAGSYAPATGAYAPMAAPQQQPVYMAQRTPSQYAPNPYAGAGVPSASTPYAGAPTPAYGAPYQSPHTAMAYQNAVPASPQAVETLPLNPPIENVPAGSLQNGALSNGSAYPSPSPYPDPASGYPPPALSGSMGGYPAPGVQPGPGYESYPGLGGGAPSAYGAGCEPNAYGACDTFSTYGGMGGVLGKHKGCGYWFGGVYALMMDRDSANKYPLTFVGPVTPPAGYYPPSSNIVVRTRDAETDFQPGVEFRLGCTFGCVPIDPCGCSCACMPQWGLEGVYWTIFEDDDYAQYVDQATTRTYSMMPMAGLEYDSGAGYRPVNEYWDYGPPVQTQDIRVTQARVSSSFAVQNLELNLLRLGVCGCDFGVAACAPPCGYDACGGCTTGYPQGCDVGCAPQPCKPKFLSGFSCTGVCGFRWLQLDESFMYGVDYVNTTSGTAGFLNYWSNVENNLIGPQIGCNGMYRIGCKWGVHLNSSVGVFANDIDVDQYMVSPTGQVRFMGTQENFDVSSSKTDVAMLGELRLGVSCQATCHCRLYTGWRAIGITGIALATDQAATQFLDAAQMSRYVNSNGSMILHGLQAGVEWNY